MSKTKTIILGVWNVHTLLDRIGARVPLRRTALVAKELQHYYIAIAALSGTCFAEEGQLTDHGFEYTL